MSSRALGVIPIHPEDEATAEIRSAKMLAYLGGHRVVVDTFDARGPLVARCLATIDRHALVRGAASGARVHVVFAEGDLDRPVVTEIVEGEGAGSVGHLDEGRGEPPGELALRVDGQERSLAIDAREELVLRCGRASITLKRDGKIVIKGSYVESRASSTNRIKGAQVRIN